jgi:hypothetical protein
VYTYSELDFKQFEVHVKGTGQITENAGLYVGVSHFNFQDDAPFVYGDQDGRVLFTQAGFKVKF